MQRNMQLFPVTHTFCWYLCKSIWCLVLKCLFSLKAILRARQTCQKSCLRSVKLFLVACKHELFLVWVIPSFVSNEAHFCNIILTRGKKGQRRKKFQCSDDRERVDCQNWGRKLLGRELGRIWCRGWQHPRLLWQLEVTWSQTLQLLWLKSFPSSWDLI